MEDKVKRAGTVDHTCANPREVIERSLELSATALILVQIMPPAIRPRLQPIFV